MKPGILYGVGVGPGDPELLTLKAQRVLRTADVIAVPDKGAGEKTALTIIGDLAEEKELLLCPAPMVRDRKALDAARDGIASRIAAVLDQGRSVAFITLGDPTVYSTYLYIHKRVRALGYEAEIVSGVPSFCAAAAKLSISLGEGAESIHILPGSYPVEEGLTLSGTKVLMKSGKQLKRVKQLLLSRGEHAMLAENCGMDGERLVHETEGIPEDAGYYSLVIVKDREEIQ